MCGWKSAMSEGYWIFPLWASYLELYVWQWVLRNSGAAVKYIRLYVEAMKLVHDVDQGLSQVSVIWNSIDFKSEGDCGPLCAQQPSPPSCFCFFCCCRKQVFFSLMLLVWFLVLSPSGKTPIIQISWFVLDLTLCPFFLEAKHKAWHGFIACSLHNINVPPPIWVYLFMRWAYIGFSLISVSLEGVKWSYSSALLSCA